VRGAPASHRGSRSPRLADGATEGRSVRLGGGADLLGGDPTLGSTGFYGSRTSTEYADFFLFVVIGGGRANEVGIRGFKRLE
jgi:hypothetical protein